MDNGKTIRETRDADIPLVVRHTARLGAAHGAADGRPAAGRGHRAGNSVELSAADARWKIAPALAMGNSLVLKPAPATKLLAPLRETSRRWASAGVVNVVCGDNEMASTSRPTRHRQACLHRLDPVGNGSGMPPRAPGSSSPSSSGQVPRVIFESADLDSAIEGMVNAIFFSQARFAALGPGFSAESVQEEFLAKLRRRMDTLGSAILSTRPSPPCHNPCLPALELPTSLYPHSTRRCLFPRTHEPGPHPCCSAGDDVGAMVDRAGARVAGMVDTAEAKGGSTSRRPRRALLPRPSSPACSRLRPGSNRSSACSGDASFRAGQAVALADSSRFGLSAGGPK